MSEAAIEEPWALPEGWRWARLGSLGAWNSGGTPKSTEPDYYGGDIQWFRITDLNDGRIRAASRTLTDRGLRESSARIVAPPFVMFAMYGASIGKMAISEIHAATNQAIACCRPSSCVSVEYLFWALQRRKKSIIDLGQGGAQPNISQQILLEQSIPLAPLAEQRRIVERIDALFAEIAEGEAALAAARQGLETFRRALLKAAVSGELTKDWRAAKPPAESAGDFLVRSTRIPTAARQGGDTETSILPTDSLRQLPEGWTSAKLHSLLEFVTSGSRGWKEYYSSDGAIFVRAQNINSGKLDLSNVAFVCLPQAAEGLRTRLKRDDILVTITGANVTVSAIVDREVGEAYVNQHIALLRPRSPDFSNFILLWLQAEGGGKTQLNNAAYGAGKPGLNLDNIREISIAIPPPAEAAEILRRVSAALAAVAETQRLLDAEAADAARLRQSILKAAFEGRLCAQDPADEPASALLARLRERGERPPARRGGPAPRAGRPKARKTAATA